MAESETIRFICSACEYRARIPASFASKVILCPKCKKKQVATADDGAASGGTARVEAVVTSDDPITGKFSTLDAQGKIRFRCLKCGFQAKLAPSYADTAIACPGCQVPQVIPPIAAVSPSPTAEGAAPSSPSSPADPSLSAPAAKPVSASHLEPFSAEEPLPKEDGPIAASAAPVRAAVAAAAESELTLDQEDEAGEKSKDGEDLDGYGAKAMRPVAIDRGGSGGGVVRRSGRAGAMWAAEEEADRRAEEERERQEALAEERARQPKELPPLLKPIVPVAKRMREPRNVAMIAAGLVVLVLEIMLLNSWHSRGIEANTRAQKIEELTTEINQLTDARNAAELKVMSSTKKYADAAAELKKVRGELDNAQQQIKEQATTISTDEQDHATLTTRVKQLGDQLDGANEKVRQAMAQREADYKRRIEAETACNEEIRLRKALQTRLDELSGPK